MELEGNLHGIMAALGHTDQMVACSSCHKETLELVKIVMPDNPKNNFLRFVCTNCGAESDLLGFTVSIYLRKGLRKYV